jgi:hypothetical protein
MRSFNFELKSGGVRWRRSCPEIELRLSTSSRTSEPTGPAVGRPDDRLCERDPGPITTNVRGLREAGATAVPGTGVGGYGCLLGAFAKASAAHRHDPGEALA